MTIVTASAPGKVVLTGEYAVLDGSPAVSMAINRRAVATLTPTDGNEVAVRSIGLAGRYDTNLFDCVVKATNLVRTDEFSFALDTGAFVDTASEVKLGIGSSAALTVALVAALLAGESDNVDVAEIAAIAHRTHRDFQQGVGSGVDIATSVAGGLIEFSMPENRVTRLTWPDGLRFALLWSGVVASTRERIDRLNAGDMKHSRARLSEEATACAGAWKSAEADAVIVACRNYVDALMTFSVDHELGIFEAGHQALAEHALAEGLVYKPCGAGGGDVGIAMATDSAQLDAFVTRAEAAGFKQLDIEPDGSGVQQTRESD